MIELLKKFPRYILFVFFISCSVSSPVIREKKWEIKVNKDIESNIIYESLSLFVNCYDEDGENDVDKLYVIDDQTGIYWELNSNNWLEKRMGDDRWLGSNSIIMPDRSSIPRKKLKVHVRDRSGEYVVDNLFITKSDIDFDELTFPELVINEDRLSITNYPSGRVFLYSSTGSFLFSGDVAKELQPFENIFGRSRDELDADIELFVNVESKDLTLESGPW